MKYIFLVFIFLSFSFASEISYINNGSLEKAHKKFGYKAKVRLSMWNSMMKEASNANVLFKLKLVNDFFNKIKYIPDSKHWKKDDYWANPYEFIGSGAGDSEDYIIAKYLSLKKLGLSINKFCIIKLDNRKKANSIVLAYYHKLNSNPIILDYNQKIYAEKNRKILTKINKKKYLQRIDNLTLNI